MKNQADYHDLYVQSETLLPADVFQSIRNKFLEIYELDSAHFRPVPGLAREANLKKGKVKN